MPLQDACDVHCTYSFAVSPDAVREQDVSRRRVAQLLQTVDTCMPG